MKFPLFCRRDNRTCDPDEVASYVNINATTLLTDEEADHIRQQLMETNERSLNAYGELGCILQLSEEMSELNKSLMKWLRVRGFGQKTETTQEYVRDSVVEELADTLAVCEQLKMLFNISDKELLVIDKDKLEKVNRRMDQS